ncbi:RagB/SusD family nutrient uptake outer membrane protein [Parabacteroides sp. OttesenSCG-928-G06]|nr:RagB/SusD family nutrient uptake outer membrane protein [Parabacteroides sp. OttesenSCG-928-G06]
MDNSDFKLTPMDSWASMFNDNVLDGNAEMIMFRKHSKELSVGNNSHTVCDVYWAMNNALVYTFLNADGTRFTDLPDYEKKTYVETFQNRDPRLSQTILPPGYIRWDDKDPTIVRAEFGGYPQLKFYPSRRDLALGWNYNYTDLPIIRLAEMYLIYAEAKATLGTLSQSDLDISVNKLRTRASLPAINMATANADIDPYLANEYKTVSGANKGVLLEILRERRVEMACEGLRKDDLFRYRLGTNMTRFTARGMYIPSLGPLDVTGDGKADIVILEQPGDKDTELYPGMRLYYLKDKAGKETTWYLENGTSGRISIVTFRDSKREFVEPKYYFYPIPTAQMVLNSNLKQLYGW